MATAAARAPCAPAAGDDDLVGGDDGDEGEKGEGEVGDCYEHDGMQAGELVAALRWAELGPPAGDSEPDRLRAGQTVTSSRTDASSTGQVWIFSFPSY